MLAVQSRINFSLRKNAARLVPNYPRYSFSSPPAQVAKQPKLENRSFVLDEEEDDLEELLLKELEEEENEIVNVKWDKENSIHWTQ